MKKILENHASKNNRTNFFYLSLGIVFISLCSSVHVNKAADHKHHALLQKVFLHIVNHEKYQPYSDAIGRPEIAKEWVQNLAKIISPLDEENAKEYTEEATLGFLNYLQELEPYMVTKIANDVFTEPVTVVTDEQRRLLWLRQKCNLMRI